MKKLMIIISLTTLFFSCEEETEKAENSRGIPGPKKVESLKLEDLDKQEKTLKREGYQTFRYQEGDSTVLMQQYYIVFLKAGQNRSQDSTEAAELQKQHLAHLSRMGREGYLSLAGPMADDGELRGIAIYNTPTQKQTDSLARLDPMVQAGRLEVEVHPWWTAKGGKLK